LSVSNRSALALFAGPWDGGLGPTALISAAVTGKIDVRGEIPPSAA
jgi:hypothetical protein